MSHAADRLILARRVLLTIAGLVCLGYALGALALGRPDPVSPFIPVIAGALAAAGLAVAAVWAGPRAAEIATDEGFREDGRRAQAIAFWVALLLYPAFGVALGEGLVSYPVAFMAMASLTPAAYLLAHVICDLQWRR